MDKKATKPVAEKPKVEVVEHTPQEKKEIQVIERIIENREIAPADAFGKMTRGQVELLKRTIAKGASDDELRMFIQVCKGAQLNPFLKQVHLVPRWDNKEGREVRSIQVSIDGFRSIAESSNNYAGNDDPIYDGEKIVDYSAKEGQSTVTKKLTVPLKATVTVYKIVAGQRYGFTATARWDEYYPGGKMGFQWHIRPFLMLGKCAEALALRKAFPKLLSGMYVQEEMDQAGTQQTEAKQTASVFFTLTKAMATANAKTIANLIAKMAKSDKYTAMQKKEFERIANARLKELNTVVAKPEAKEKNADS